MTQPTKKRYPTMLGIALGIALGIGSSLLAPTPKPATTEPQVAPRETRKESQAFLPRAQPRPENPMDNDFYRIIVDNNLFRPLGWKPPKKRDAPYQLIGTITNSNVPARAILQHRTSKRTYTVSIGETLGDFQVTEIQPRRVTLKNGTKHVNLELDNTLLINPRDR